MAARTCGLCADEAPPQLGAVPAAAPSLRVAFRRRFSGRSARPKSGDGTWIAVTCITAAKDARARRCPAHPGVHPGPLGPRPLLGEPNFNFSFSGLKTAVLYYIDKVKGTQHDKALSPQVKADIAMSFENAVADVITKKAVKAVAKYKCKTVALSGGVAANRKLRAELAAMCKDNGINFTVPDFELCTDNAQMIALAAYFNLRASKKPVPAGKVKADPAWELR